MKMFAAKQALGCNTLNPGAWEYQSTALACNYHTVRQSSRYILAITQ